MVSGRTIHNKHTGMRGEGLGDSGVDSVAILDWIRSQAELFSSLSGTANDWRIEVTR